MSEHPLLLGGGFGSPYSIKMRGVLRYYHEAIAAQPGSAAPNHDALNDWIFGGTALGDTLQAVADRLTQADDPMANLVRGLLIPEGRYNGGSAF